MNEKFDASTGMAAISFLIMLICIIIAIILKFA